MTIKKLIEWAESPNIANEIMAEDKGEDVLIQLGAHVCEMANQDDESMHDWKEMIKQGMKIAKPEIKANDKPWDGAANYKSPVIYEAVRDFGDRASREILRKENLCAYNLEGNPDPQLKESAKRIETHINYQLNNEIKGYRKLTEKNIYRLAAQGCLFKKTYFDSTKGLTVSKWIGYPNFIIDNKNTECFDDCSRFTEVMMISSNDIYSYVQAGIWLDPELDTEDEDKSEHQYEGDYKFYEQHLNYDLDNDGYAEPYIVTVHKESSKVVRIVARYKKEDIKVSYNGGVDAIGSITESIQSINYDGQSEDLLTSIRENRESDLLENAELVSIEPIDIISHFEFLHPIDDTFLAMGFLHILANPSKGINKSTNSLFNAGDLSNLQGGFLSKEHRDKRKGPIKFYPGKWMVTDINSANLANSVNPLPIKEPSQTLFNLTEGLKAESKEQSTKINLGEMMSPNVPAASVLGMLQEGVIPTTALIARIINSMTKEFEVIFKLNSIYTDPIVYERLNQTPDFDLDYSKDIRIKPTANAEFSSSFQRMQRAEIQMAQVPMVMQAGFNAMPIFRDYFEAIGSELTDEIFNQEPSDADKQAQAQMMQMQQQQQEIQQQQLALAQAQLQMARDNTDSLIQEREVKNVNSTLKTISDLQKAKADTILKLEQAETEDEKNTQESYIREIETTIRVIEALNDTKDRETQNRIGTQRGGVS